MQKQFAQDHTAENWWAQDSISGPSNNKAYVLPIASLNDLFIVGLA